MTNNTSTDCRSPDGVTVGIIDSIIVLCRLLIGRDLSAFEIVEALKDLEADEDFNFLLQELDKIR